MEYYDVTQVITDEVPQDELWEKIYKTEEILKDKYFPEDEYILVKVLAPKTNNVVRRGISIRIKDTKTAPTFYVNEDDFASSSEEQVAYDIYKSYNDQKDYQSKLNSFDLGMLLDYQRVKDMVYPMFLNKGLNNNLDLVFYDIENIDDVVIAFYINLQDIDNSMKSLIKANNAMFKLWNISIQELLDQSIINLNKKGYYNKNIATYLIDRAESFGRKLPFETFIMAKTVEKEDNMPDIITTDKNLDFMYGSSFIYAARKELADKYNGEFYFVLSSIHEAMIIKKDIYEKLPDEDIHEMVMYVNENILAKNDFLSDSVYKYIGSEDRFVKVC